MRIVVRVLIAIVALLGLLWFGGRLYLRRSIARYGGTIATGVSAPVEITFDAKGIPQVWAKTDADAFFAVASWVVRGELPELEGKLQTLDVPTWRLQTHTLDPAAVLPGVRRRRRSRAFQPPALAHRKKTFTSDGGHRVVPPEETLARNGHHVSPITGAVPMLERAAPARRRRPARLRRREATSPGRPGPSASCAATCAP